VNTSAEEKLREIARQLVAAREALGMPLEEVATKTFIPIRTLKALEAAETFKLPEPIFVQGFIKRYAKLVGLDGDTLAKEIPLDQTPIAINIVKEPAARALVPPINKRVSLDEPTAERESIFSKIAPPTVGTTPQEPLDRPAWLIPALAGLVGFGFVVGAIALIANRPQPVTTAPSPSASPSPKPKASIKPSPTVSPIVEPSESLSPSPSPTPSPTPSPSPSPVANVTTGPVNVGLNLSDDSWVEVKADGKVVFEGTMAKGTNQNWSAQKEIEVTSGNAGAVTVSQNQKPGKVMGAAGDVKTTTFSGK
jgi:cytoskeleton protein RodZ